MKKNLWHGIVIGMICAASVGCSFAHKEETMPDTAVRVENLRIDNYFVQGKNVQVFDEVPKRVLVVGDNETETLIELGAAPAILLAAAENDGPFPMKEENARILETLPRAMNQQLHMEYVMQIEPDLIIGNQYCFTRNSGQHGLLERARRKDACQSQQLAAAAALHHGNRGAGDGEHPRLRAHLPYRRCG